MPAAKAPSPMEVEVARLKAATEQVARENAELRNTMQILAQTQQKNADLSAQLKDSTREAGELQSANARLNTSLTESNAKLQQATADLKAVDERARTAEADRAAAERRILALQNAQLKDQIQDLRDNLKDTQKTFRQQLDWDDFQNRLAAEQLQNSMLAWLMQQRNAVVRNYYPDWYPWVPVRDRDRGRRVTPPNIVNPGPIKHNPPSGSTTEIVKQTVFPGSIDGGKLLQGSKIDGGKLIQASDINGGGDTTSQPRNNGRP
jgi:hypothetical protein